MATAEEVLAMGVSDVLTVDADLRKIIIPNGMTIIGVEGDDDVNRLHFSIPRTYGEFDLSTFDIRINYLNANNKGDIYEVKDATVDESAGVINFSWLVGSFATAYKGNVKFIVCLKRSEDGEVAQEFNTTLASLSVLEGLEPDKVIVQENPDVIENILKRLGELEKNGGGSGVGIDDEKASPNTTYSSEKIEQKIKQLNEKNAQQDERLTTLERGGGIATVEPAHDDVPLLFYGGALPQTKDETEMSIAYASKTLKRDGSAETKAQGNSSMSWPKKNQTTKFAQAINFKGWGLQKKYCIKANWIDLTHSRNIVSAQLWGDVVKSRVNYLDLPELFRTSPNHGAVDGFPALVYADGVYQGRYTINIPKDAWMANMDKTMDNHCMLCGENYVSGCFRATAKIDESDWTDEIHDTVPAAIKTRWNEIISFVMNASDSEFKANLGNYFYIDSLIDYYIFGVVSCGLDAFGKNQLYQTYDGQKWIATMYDMDSTWGLWWNGGSFVATTYARTEFQDFKDGQGNLLYIRLEELFYEQIQERWAELKDGALSYSNIMERFERFIGIVPPHIVKEDYASTTGGGKFTGIPSQSSNHIQQIRAYAAARLPYANEWFASLTPDAVIPCTGITLNQTALTFDGAGTQTLTATVNPSNTTDPVMWNSNDNSVASVVDGVVTAKANGNATITATCGAYSVTCAVSVSGIESEDEINIFDNVTFSQTGHINGSNGEVVSSTDWNSGYVDISAYAGKRIVYSISNNNSRAAFYDSDKTFISAITLRGNIVVPENAAFVRFSLNTVSGLRDNTFEVYEVGANETDMSNAAVGAWSDSGANPNDTGSKYVVYNTEPGVGWLSFGPWRVDFCDANKGNVESFNNLEVMQNGARNAPDGTTYAIFTIGNATYSAGIVVITRDYRLIGKYRFA